MKSEEFKYGLLGEHNFALNSIIFLDCDILTEKWVQRNIDFLSWSQWSGGTVIVNHVYIYHEAYQSKWLKQLKRS